MTSKELTEINDGGFRLHGKVRDNRLQLRLEDTLGRSATYSIDLNDVSVENSHRIGRELKMEFKHINNSVLEASDLSRIIGMVQNYIELFKKQFP